METFFSSIKLNNNLKNYISSDGKILDSIDNLSEINIFIGANNSGKSRFLRELAKTEDFEFNTNNPDTKKYLKFIEDISTGLSAIKNDTGNKGIINFDVQGKAQFGENSFPVFKDSFYKNGVSYSSFINNIIALQDTSVNYRVTSYSGATNIMNFQNQIRAFLDSKKEEIDFIKKFKIEKQEFERYYFPISRSLNNFQKEIGKSGSDNDFIDFFKERTTKIYEIKTSILDVFTGQDLYFSVRNMLLGDESKRLKIANYEKFLGNEIFNNKINLIPRVDHDVLNIKIGTKAERPIYELGDGVQGLIIMTFLLFTTEKSMFFIEEPETHLHPGMQRKFLELILKINKLENKNHQFFITTHSNHFLDLTFDYNNISIYKFSEKDKDNDIKVVEQVNFGDSSLLQELGARKSSVFITNSTIWVEGITDRLYIKKFLDLYQEHQSGKKFYEDIDYSFVEYGGNNITHWSFLKTPDPVICIERLCGKSFLITDKDGKNKIERQKELKKILGDRYKCLDCREIENILSLTSIIKGIKKFSQDKNYTLPNKINIKSYDYKNKPIGKYIQDNLKPKNKYNSKSGAMSSDKKLDFCRNVIEDMTYDEMTSIAKKLAEKLYKFISEQNR